MFVGFFGLFVLLFFLIIFAIAIAGTVFWIWMIVDCASNEPPAGNDKIVWLLVIVLTHLVGAIIYYFVRRPQRISMLGR